MCKGYVDGHVYLTASTRTISLLPSALMPFTTYITAVSVEIIFNIHSFLVPMIQTTTGPIKVVGILHCHNINAWELFYVLNLPTKIIGTVTTIPVP